MRRVQLLVQGPTWMNPQRIMRSKKKSPIYDSIYIQSFKCQNNKRWRRNQCLPRNWGQRLYLWIQLRGALRYTLLYLVEVVLHNAGDKMHRTIHTQRQVNARKTAKMRIRFLKCFSVHFDNVYYSFPVGENWLKGTQALFVLSMQLPCKSIISK